MTAVGVLIYYVWLITLSYALLVSGVAFVGPLGRAVERAWFELGTERYEQLVLYTFGAGIAGGLISTAIAMMFTGKLSIGKFTVPVILIVAALFVLGLAPLWVRVKDPRTVGLWSRIDRLRDPGGREVDSTQDAIRAIDKDCQKIERKQRRSARWLWVFVGLGLAFDSVLVIRLIGGAHLYPADPISRFLVAALMAGPILALLARLVIRPWSLRAQLAELHYYREEAERLVEPEATPGLSMSPSVTNVYHQHSNDMRLTVGALILGAALGRVVLTRQPRSTKAP